MKLLLSREQTPLPPLIDGFATGEVALHLGYLRDTLGDKPFLLGDRLQGPDIGVGYILQLAKRVGELGPYPSLESYLDRLTARPAFQRARERAGE
jgi:glutathione S-transferase